MIKVNGLRKTFHNTNQSSNGLEVLKGISFQINQGDVVSVIGPSGSGKSTMLRCLMELEKADGGDIFIEGNCLCKDGVYLEKQAKSICAHMGMVFQHFNLFPHMTVEENLKLAPNLKKYKTRKEIDEQCQMLLHKVGLLDKIYVNPSKLSGGQKQRVAIARALMLNPDIMLFDEPTSALDPELTQEVLSVIKELADEKMTMLIVTHEIAFAKEASNRILFMDQGIVIEDGTPQEVIDNPQNERTISFLQKVL